VERRFTIQCTMLYRSPRWILSRLSAILTARELNRVARAEEDTERFYPVERRDPELFLYSPFNYTERTLSYL